MSGVTTCLLLPTTTVWAAHAPETSSPTLPTPGTDRFFLQKPGGKSPTGKSSSLLEVNIAVKSFHTGTLGERTQVTDAGRSELLRNPGQTTSSENPSGFYKSLSRTQLTTSAMLWSKVPAPLLGLLQTPLDHLAATHPPSPR